MRSNRHLDGNEHQHRQYIQDQILDANTLNVPRVGDHLSPDSHSVLIVGTSFDDGASSPEQKLRLHIVEGNMDHGAPGNSRKRVRYRSILASAHNLSGVGQMNLPTVNE